MLSVVNVQNLDIQQPCTRNSTLPILAKKKAKQNRQKLMIMKYPTFWMYSDR